MEYRDRALFMEDVPLADVAERSGTPCYVYSATAIRDRYGAYQTALGILQHRICYAVKANSNLALLSLLAKLGAGFDIVSGGELYRALKAGGRPDRIMFSGVGKTADEIAFALREGIHSFNCESEAELSLIDALAERARVTARVALRVNPNVDASTHPYISTGLKQHKFGIDAQEAEEVYERARSLRNLSLEGLTCHIGSQILDLKPMAEAFERMVELAARLKARGLPIRFLDLGGGLGVRYRPNEIAPEIAEFVHALVERVSGAGLEIMIEPGRSIVAEAGVLLTRVLYRKETSTKEFVIVDAAMNDLIRPALYQSHHEIIPLRKDNRPKVKADVVGPVCETGDFLARDREMAEAEPGDYLAICTAGAYGFVAASNYNSRPRPAEVLVDGADWRIIRKRETYEDLVRGEEHTATSRH